MTPDPATSLAIARIVADHALCLVIAALDGETDPAELGVCEGPDAVRIRELVA